MLAVAGVANAQAYGSGVDGQSVFRVSDTQVVNATATAARSTKLASETRVVRLSCLNDCHFEVGGPTVTATSASAILFGGVTEYFKVPSYGAKYISVVRDGADGKLFIDQMLP